MDVFARFSAATVSNFWSRLESFELSMEFNVSCGLGTQVFHFLGGQYSPRHFKLSCHSNQSLNQENVNFGDIIRSLIPNTNLRSIDIQFKMDESSLLLLSNFLSNCENLEEVRLNLESPYSQDDTKILQFLADVALLPNLAILVVPFPISSAGLHDLERTLSFRRSKRFIQELWLLADIGTSLLDALPRFLDSQANLGFLAIGVPCETHFSASAIRFFDWIASSQPRNLKSFTLHTLKLPYMGVTSLRPYHEQVQQCYPALESLLSTCKFLELMCICGIRITDVERGMMERVRITRKRNGLKQLNFEIQS
ncbi:hypothetical protein BC829DRAFT_387509 [Chytridium lagenaria]|nr:hypothetical protein BC829DRAFT_387509 [Chytridium lagenaria]